jgi:uncharacterized protein (TIGR00645 family)
MTGEPNRLGDQHRPHAIERGFESILYASRWLLAPLYLGLIVVLGLFVLKFVGQLIDAVRIFASETEGRLIVVVLNLVDVTLLASLVLMVILHGYRNMVSEFDDVRRSAMPYWLRQIDSLELKTKLFGAIVAISGIQVLSAFMDIAESKPATDEMREDLAWMLGAHLVFVISGLLLALTDRWSLKTGARGSATEQEARA